MTGAVAICGWLLAVLAAVTVLSDRRRSAARAEAAARACHELRGPLTCLRLGLELVARERRLSVARLRALELGLSQAALALDDLEASSRVRRPEWVDVGRLLADTVEAYRARAGGAVRLRRCDTAPAIWVWGDRVRLAQATTNLIANGLEHGAGPVEVSAASAPGWAQIEVADDGAGLPAPVADLMNAPRSGRWRWRKRPRRGRGLAIAASIAEAHGGVLVAAPSDRGARLVLRVPSREAGPPPPPVTNERVEPSPFREVVGLRGRLRLVPAKRQ